MSRYIDADALIEKFINSDANGIALAIDRYALKCIDDAPSIDIVRCKECKCEPICMRSVQHTTHEPTSVTIGYKSVDFCSYGERKDQ